MRLLIWTVFYSEMFSLLFYSRVSHLLLFILDRDLTIHTFCLLKCSFTQKAKVGFFGFFLSFFFPFETRITVIKTRRLRNTWGVLEVAQAGSLLVVTAGDTTQLWKPYCVQLMDSASASPGRQALPDSKFLCIAKDW